MIKYIHAKTLLDFHEDQINQYGGNRGVRDKKLLNLALEHSEKSNGEVRSGVFKIAAAYGANISRAKPFFDGYNRIALIAVYTFLYVNGKQLKAANKDLCRAILQLSKGKLGVDEFAGFLEENSLPRN
ncbi:MAG: Fic family protein [Balneolaceae bacterium]